MISLYVLFRPSYFLLRPLYNTSSWNCCFCRPPRPGIEAPYGYSHVLFAEGCQDKGNIFDISTVLDVPDRCFHRHNRSNFPYHAWSLFDYSPYFDSHSHPVVCICIPWYQNVLPCVNPKIYYVLYLYIVGLDYVPLASNIRNRRTRQK